jgi:hypothetical protein
LKREESIESKARKTFFIRIDGLEMFFLEMLLLQVKREIAAAK